MKLVKLLPLALLLGLLPDAVSAQVVDIHRNPYGGLHINVPFVRIDTGRLGTRVQAPFTYVQTGYRRTYVRAPFTEVQAARQSAPATSYGYSPYPQPLPAYSQPAPAPQPLPEPTLTRRVPMTTAAPLQVLVQVPENFKVARVYSSPGQSRIASPPRDVQQAGYQRNQPERVTPSGYTTPRSPGVNLGEPAPFEEDSPAQPLTQPEPAPPTPLDLDSGPLLIVPQRQPEVLDDPLAQPQETRKTPFEPDPFEPAPFENDPLEPAPFENYPLEPAPFEPAPFEPEPAAPEATVPFGPEPAAPEPPAPSTASVPAYGVFIPVSAETTAPRVSIQAITAPPQSLTPGQYLLTPVDVSELGSHFSGEAGVHFVAVIHPASGKTVCFPVRVPAGKPTVSQQPDSLHLQYAQTRIDIRFRPDGFIEVNRK